MNAGLCAEGEGDCDEDHDCMSGYFCGTNNGGDCDALGIDCDDNCQKAKSGSCLLGNAQILLKNGSTKAVSEIQHGEVILDGNLKPVIVESVVTNYLYDRTLYEFEDGPIFTEDHLFYSDIEEEKLGTT